MKRPLVVVAFAFVTSVVLAPSALAQQDQYQQQEQTIEEQVEQQLEQQTGVPVETNVEVQENAQGNPVPVGGEATFLLPAQGPSQQPPQMGQEAQQGAPQQQQQQGGSQQAQPMPGTGGIGLGTLVVPAVALLLGAGVLAYALMRRR
jgi:hypothetical protein